MTRLLLLGTVATFLSVSSGYLNVLTGLLFLFTLFLGFALLFHVLMSASGTSLVTRRKVQTAIATTAIALAGGELFLRYGLDRYDTYSERNGSFNYRSPHLKPPRTWFLTHEPNVPIHRQRPEFVHAREVNSLGLSEREIATVKEPDEYRIVVLGDSFTEGLGAPYESSWPRVLERKLASATTRRITVINAGIIASDVCFEYILLREKLLALGPDMVIVAINNTDVADVVQRGGMERFREDGTTVYASQAPSWEWLFGISYLTRHIVLDLFGFDYFLLTEEQRATLESGALTKILDTLGAFRNLSRERGLELIILLHPESGSELFTNRYEGGFAPVAEAIASRDDLTVIDLLRYYADHRLMTDDPWPYFWPIDAHHNADGYAIMGQVVANLVLPRATGE